MNYARYQFDLMFSRPVLGQLPVVYVYPGGFRTRAEAQAQLAAWFSFDTGSHQMHARLTGARVVRGSRQTRAQHFAEV